MTSMVEKVADAIRRELFRFGIDDLDVDELTPIAKAAIDAIMVPSEGIVEAGAECLFGDNAKIGSYCQVQFEKAWNAAIKAALTEG